jgi:CBS domain containing-hemolysin-like protein
MESFETILQIIATVGVSVLLLLIIAMHPPRSSMSMFELRRRAKEGEKRAQAELRREKLIGDVVSLRRVSITLLTIVMTILSITLFGWILGTLVVMFIALEEYGFVSRTRWFYRLAQRLYARVEPSLLRLVEQYPHVFAVIRTRREAHPDGHIESQEQLLHLVDGAEDALTSDEKRLIRHSLSFSHKLVSSVMIPAGAIDKIANTELLGPLVLDDLHQTGHSRFPVINKDIDHVVGILYIRDLLTINGSKRTITAEKAMDPHVYYIREDQTLDHALAAFLQTHHHLFIVVNEEHETVGLITLGDILKALFGRRIIDEFDNHDNLRAVAARSVRRHDV